MPKLGQNYYYDHFCLVFTVRKSTDGEQMRGAQLSAAVNSENTSL